MQLPILELKELSGLSFLQLLSLLFQLLQHIIHAIKRFSSSVICLFDSLALSTNYSLQKSPLHALVHSIAQYRYVLRGWTVQVRYFRLNRVYVRLLLKQDSQLLMDQLQHCFTLSALFHSRFLFRYGW